jgi:hypothetical protein
VRCARLESGPSPLPSQSPGSIRFDDLHDGIFPFDFLRDLGEHRLSWAKNYIRLLRQAGLSRDPRRRGVGSIVAGGEGGAAAGQRRCG